MNYRYVINIRNVIVSVFNGISSFLLKNMYSLVLFFLKSFRNLNGENEWKTSFCEP